MSWTPRWPCALPRAAPSAQQPGGLAAAAGAPRSGVAHAGPAAATGAAGWRLPRGPPRASWTRRQEAALWSSRGQKEWMWMSLRQRKASRHRRTSRPSRQLLQPRAWRSGSASASWCATRSVRWLCTRGRRCRAARPPRLQRTSEWGVQGRCRLACSHDGDCMVH